MFPPNSACRLASSSLIPSLRWSNSSYVLKVTSSHFWCFAWGSLCPGSQVHQVHCSYFTLTISSVQSLSHVQLFGDPMDCSMPGLPVHHQLPEFTQTHVCWVGDAIQPSHPLSSPSSPALSLPHHQGLFQWVGSLHQVAKVLEFQLQHQSFQWIFRVGFL